MSASDLTRRRAVVSTAALSALLGSRACAAPVPRRPSLTTPTFPTLNCPPIAVSRGQRFASFDPVLSGPAPIDMDFSWRSRRLSKAMAGP